MKIRSLYAAFGALILLAAAVFSNATAQDMGANYPIDWWAPSNGSILPGALEFENSSGVLGIVNTSGPLDTKGHPFFEPLGSNGRACVSCHQPSAAMSVSAGMMRERWRKTSGKDPVFAAIDGSNCPGLPQGKEASHSLLINRGLFRVGIKWPPPNAEFTIEAVRDPSSCNTDPVWGLKSRNPTVSVFRRPRITANLKYVMAGDAAFNSKNGELTDIDPETGGHVAMNLMADARAATLKLQAMDAALTHMQAKTAPSAEQLRRIVDFESGIYLAQTADRAGGRFPGEGAPDGLGPQALEQGKPGRGDDPRTPVFGRFEAWKDLTKSTGLTEARRDFRESAARGAELFMTRPFWIRDTANLNNTGMGNPVKRTCATCHNARFTGTHLAPGFIDLGTNNYPNWTEPGLYSESGSLPVFKVTCGKSAPPHPYLGRTIYTTDPGRALISGKCADVGSIVMPQFRGLAARAPYFANGSAQTLGDIVDYYDTRFDMKMTRTEKTDLINFLSAL